MNYESVLQLNKYPTDRYNVLVPVTTMQAASNLQRIVVSEVQLDTRQDNTNRGPSKDIYFEKSSGAFAITKVGGMKLAAAAKAASGASKWPAPLASPEYAATASTSTTSPLPSPSACLSRPAASG